MDTIATPMPSPATTLRTLARTRNWPRGVTISIWIVLPALGGFFVWIKSPPSAIVVTCEISRCSDVFQATTADFGAFSLGYRRVVALPVIRRNPAFTVPITPGADAV